MTTGQPVAPFESTRFTKSAWAKWALALVFCVFGVVLLVAGKSTAGGALLGSAMILAVPFHRIMKDQRLSVLRIGLIAVLCFVAVRSIANTDIPPDQATSGYKFVDQVSAIVKRFVDNLVGREAAQHASPK